jgi:VanZ family protein
MLTKNLLVRNKILLGLAIGWTTLIGVLCLIKSRELPSIHIIGIDKFVHFTLHFVFTMLWGGYALEKQNATKLTNILLVVGCSLLYGILIEFLQETMTTTRHADIYDVFANLAGALTALLIFVVIKYTNTKSK